MMMMNSPAGIVIKSLTDISARPTRLRVELLLPCWRLFEPVRIVSCPSILDSCSAVWSAAGETKDVISV